MFGKKTEGSLQKLSFGQLPIEVIEEEARETPVNPNFKVVHDQRQT
jgi:hypothetical protein